MKKRNETLALAAGGMFCLSTLLTGCMCTGGGVTSSTLPITEKDVYTSLGEVSGSDGTLVLWIFPIAPTSAHAAVQDAKRKKGADGLINVTVENQWYVPILPISYSRIKVSGEAVKFQRNAAN